MSVSGSAPLRRDDDGVLDAHAADAGEVDARLDRHDVADEQGITGRRRHSRRFVDLETDAVAGRVRERVGPTRVGDDVARRAVDVGALDVGGDRVASGLLALEHDVVEMTGVGAGIADRDRARHVGAVAVDDATEVAHDELVAADHTIGRVGRAASRRSAPTR